MPNQRANLAAYLKYIFEQPHLVNVVVDILMDSTSARQEFLLRVAKEAEEPKVTSALIINLTLRHPSLTLTLNANSQAQLLEFVKKLTNMSRRDKEIIAEFSKALAVFYPCEARDVNGEAPSPSPSPSPSVHGVVGPERGHLQIKGDAQEVPRRPGDVFCALYDVSCAPLFAREANGHGSVLVFG
jgi:hypothetical protein